MSLCQLTLQKLKFLNQDRAQFTYKWKASAVSRGIWTILPLQSGSLNLAKFFMENWALLITILLA